MKLLLHACCAPCSIYPLKTLRAENIEPTLFWYNPNIHPYTEYKARRDCLKHYAEQTQIKLILEDAYGLDAFVCAVGDDYFGRCQNYCYPRRLRQVFAYAKEHGYDTVSTTLLYSIYQKHDIIKELMERLAKEYKVDFLYRDFRAGWQEGQAEARQLELYIQKYCGCVFSEEEAMFGRELRRELKAEDLAPTDANVRKVLEKRKIDGEVKITSNLTKS